MQKMPDDVSEAAKAPPRSPIERQLDIGLMVVQVAALLLVIWGGVYLASGWDGSGDRTRYGTLQVAIVFLMLPGTVVFFSARSARRRLAAQVVSARLFSILTGTFSILAGLPVLVSIGAVNVVAGLFALTAALLLKKDTLR
jgi:peptidoglycan/LPS O-acetylase OafA/YrhL